MKTRSPKIGIQLACVLGIGLLLGVVYWVAIETRGCSILSYFSKNCSEQIPASGSSSPHALIFPSAETSRDIQGQPYQSERTRMLARQRMAQRDSYFLSRQDYEDFLLGLPFLFYRAYRQTPPSEAGLYEMFDFLDDESLLDYPLPEALVEERFEIRRLYRKMQREKRLWDQYLQERYENILETTLEPAVIRSQHINLENEENRKYFLEQERDLKLHRRLIRDIRMFHDEIQFQTKQYHARQPYELYDLKFKLSPFARESGLADALQQALSALSVGLYQREAAAVIERLGEAYTKPVRQLYQKLQNTNEPTFATDYNYDIFIVHGKKLLDYTDMLAQQSLITLDPAIVGELEIFKRRLSQSFYDLYQIGLNETVSSTHLDFEELERNVRAMH